MKLQSQAAGPQAASSCQFILYGPLSDRVAQFILIQNFFSLLALWLQNV